MKILKTLLPHSILPFALAMVSVAPVAWGATRPVELKWHELGSAITGKTVDMTLPGGATVKGEVVAFREDELVLDVFQTSNAQIQPTGSATIPRSSVTVVKLSADRGTDGQKLAPILGPIAGVTLGGYLAAKAGSAGPAVAIFIGTAAATTIAAHELGRRADRRVRILRLIP